MNILFCGDSGVCRGIFYSAVSLCKHTKEDLVFYILTASIENRKAVTPDFAQKLYDKCGSKNKEIVWFPKGGHSVLRFIDTEKYDSSIKAFLKRLNSEE